MKTGTGNNPLFFDRSEFEQQLQAQGLKARETRPKAGAVIANISLRDV